MVTIFDVAKEAGVSKSTVSRVINRDTKVKHVTKEYCIILQKLDRGMSSLDCSTHLSAKY